MDSKRRRIVRPIPYPDANEIISEGDAMERDLEDLDTEELKEPAPFRPLV